MADCAQQCAGEDDIADAVIPADPIKLNQHVQLDQLHSAEFLSRDLYDFCHRSTKTFLNTLAAAAYLRIRPSL